MQIENDTSASRLLDDRVIQVVDVHRLDTITGGSTSAFDIFLPLSGELSRVERVMLTIYPLSPAAEPTVTDISLRQDVDIWWERRQVLGVCGYWSLDIPTPIRLTPGVMLRVRYDHTLCNGTYLYDLVVIVGRYVRA